MAYYCSVNTSTFTSTGFLSHSSWVGAGNANWSVELDFVVTSLAADRYLYGNNSGSATRSIRINADGSVRVNGVAAISISPAGTIAAGTRYNIKLESVGTTKNVYVKLQSDPSYGAAVCTGTDNFSYTFNTICRASAVYSRFFDIYGLTTSGGTFNETWDGSNSPSSGTTWTGANSNQITLNGTQGAPDAWWVFYSSGATYDLQALGGTFTYSGAAAALNRGFRLDATGGTFSYSGAVADLTYNTATVYRIDALGGSFTYTGAQATLLRNFRVDATGGTFSYAGADASLTYVSGPMVYTITALGGTFSYTGAAAELTATGVIPAANPAAFVNRAYVGGRLTNSAKIGGRLTNNATVAI